MMFVSLIKEALKISDESYYEQLYTYQGKHNKKSKSFTFANFFQNISIQGDQILHGGRIRLFLSSPDPIFFSHFYNGITQIDIFRYKDIKMKKLKIFPIPVRRVGDREVIFKTLSPIYMKDSSGKALTPFEEKFREELNYITNLSLKNFQGVGLKRPLEFQPLKMKKTVIKEKVSTTDGYIYLESYKGVFKLVGDPEDLNTIHELGIGFRRNQGFGMIEVI